jgi:SAM-dependent methyltransferase
MIEIENQYVHNIYNAIAEEFDDSRYCVWNFVKKFLHNKEHLYGIDIGCGNGKNMIYDNMIGIDTCPKFVEICKTKNKEVFLYNCDKLLFHESTFDYAMAISVYHHLSTNKRRIDSIGEMIRVVKPGGEMVFNMWSVENQDKRKFISGDNYVPWITRPQKHKSINTFNRYYYIYDEKTIYMFIEEIKNTYDVIINDVYNEKGNWVIRMTKEKKSCVSFL